MYGSKKAQQNQWKIREKQQNCKKFKFEIESFTHISKIIESPSVLAMPKRSFTFSNLTVE